MRPRASSRPLQVLPVSAEQGGATEPGQFVAGRNGRLRADHQYVSAVALLGRRAEAPGAHAVTLIKAISETAVHVPDRFFDGPADRVFELDVDGGAYVQTRGPVLAQPRAPGSQVVGLVPSFSSSGIERQAPLVHRGLVEGCRVGEDFLIGLSVGPHRREVTVPAVDLRVSKAHHEPRTPEVEAPSRAMPSRPEASIES